MDKIRLTAFYPATTGLVDVFDESDLQKAVDAKAKIYAIDETTHMPGDMYFDGDKWLVDKPVFIKEDNSVVLASAYYVDAVAEVVQSELEAVVNAVADTLPLKTATTLRKQLATARSAMSAGDAVQMASISKELSPDDKALFTVAQAKEMTNGLTT